MKIESLKQMIPSFPDEQLHELFAKAALQLDNGLINTVSFVFWFCYMAETDLNSIIRKVCGDSLEKCTLPGSKELYKGILNRMVFEVFGGHQICEKCGQGKYYDVGNLEYFSDKIKIAVVFLGKSRWTNLLWVLNNLRNDISHNRLGDLKYGDKSLGLREVKEELLFDYLKASQESVDKNEFPIWQKLPEDLKKDLEREFNIDFSTGG